MTATAKVLYPAADLPAAAAALYTSPTNGKGTGIDKVTAVNHSAAARAVSFYRVPSGGLSGNSNCIVYGKSIAVAATDLMPEIVGKFLAPGDSIWGNADTASAVNFEMNGRELT